ncbi:MAG: hypothetical protein VYA27_04290 [Verrucomicrobiota bacterium]|nr:hypothetical protein [Verrucomicrobiota bacterium]
MKKYHLLLGGVVLVLAAILFWPRARESGGEAGGEVEEPALPWFKGNTHTHTLWSDGNDFPDMVVDWYKEQGYDFLALSDHNILSEGEKWMKTSAIEGRKKAEGPSVLEKYRKRFGDEWVETRGEGGNEEIRLKTLDELRPEFEEESRFLLVEAEEITDSFERHQVHINALNLEEVSPPQTGTSVVETMRNNLRMVREQAERLGKPIVAHLNHPNFHFSFTAEQLAEVVEEQFFEVYNGHPGINHLGDETHPGDEELWDLANAIRVGKLKAPPLFGVATDDSHQYHGGNVSPGRGWIMVRAERLEADLLMEAMERGEFYSSSGVILKEVSFRDDVIELEVEGESGVTYSTQFLGVLKGEKTRKEFAVSEELRPVYRLRGDELYVRAVVTSSKDHPNPSFADQKEQAWTQPVGWRKAVGSGE